MAKKEFTYNFYIKDKEGNSININTLSEDERKEVGIWAYQTLLKGLGYEPVKEKSIPDSADAVKQELEKQKAEAGAVPVEAANIKKRNRGRSR